MRGGTERRRKRDIERYKDREREKGREKEGVSLQARWPSGPRTGRQGRAQR